MNVLIVEDHSVVRLGLVLLLKDVAPRATITEAGNFRQVITCLQTQQMDLILLDINIPGGDNLNMIGQIRQLTRSPILVISSYDERIYAIRCLKEGAAGYVQKDAAPEEIKAAVLSALNLQPYASPSVRQQLLTSQYHKPGSSPWAEDNLLSEREKEIMYLLAMGLSTKEIKNKLGIQLSTVSTHKTRIFEKLGVKNVVELAFRIKDQPSEGGQPGEIIPPDEQPS